MDTVVETLREDWQSFLAFSPKLLYAVAMLLIFLALAAFLGRLTERLLSRSTRLTSNARFVRRLVAWSLRIMGILLALSVMGFEGVAASLLATGGVVAIVLGFAFREIGENLLAGIFLAFSRPFNVGDLVKSGDIRGKVRGIDMRSVHIRTADACDVYVPNAQIFRQELFNYTRDGLRRPGFRVGVAYHDDPKAVIAVLEDAARSVDNVLETPASIVEIAEFADSHIVYAVYFWMDTSRSSRDIVLVENDVKIACWNALREAGLTFSTDVTTALDIKTAPELRVTGTAQA